MDDRGFLFLNEEKPFHNIWPRTLQGGRCLIVSLQSRDAFRDMNTEDLPQERPEYILLEKTFLKSLFSSGTRLFEQMKSRLTCTRMMEKERKGS